ncbi:MAG TPA: 3-isopropylmalate dehydratase small subunit [Spirochaetaceae bacterium]|nr:3-isopropylmalate dehydratase small subunit [Spirochaetaceae bacterium]
MNGTGSVFKYGRDVDTDVIIPARHLNSSDPATLASHCMEDIDARFASMVQPGDWIVALENFGCGSSREHAPIAIKASGVACVIASSFARIFYRNAINIGLPIMECPEAAREANAGDRLEADYVTGLIVNATQGKRYQAQPFPPFMQGIIAAGGLMEYTRRAMQAARKPASETAAPTEAAAI